MSLRVVWVWAILTLCQYDGTRTDTVSVSVYTSSVNAFVFLTSALWVPISPCRKCSVKSFVRWFKRQDLYLLHYFSFGLVRHKSFLQQFFQGKVPLRHLIRYGQWTFWWSLYEDLTSNKYKWFHPKYISLLTTLT